jgi:hypothetical protein
MSSRHRNSPAVGYWNSGIEFSLDADISSSTYITSSIHVQCGVTQTVPQGLLKENCCNTASIDVRVQLLDIVLRTETSGMSGHLVWQLDMNFRRNQLPLSSGLKCKLSKEGSSVSCLLTPFNLFMVYLTIHSISQHNIGILWQNQKERNH